MRQLPDATAFFVFVKAASRGIPLAARTPKLPNFSPHSRIHAFTNSRISPNTRRTAHGTKTPRLPSEVTPHNEGQEVTQD